MNKNILVYLLEDHRALRRQMDGLEGGAPRLAVLEFADALETHAHAEETLLFRELAHHLPGPFTPVHAMETDHREIEADLATIRGGNHEPLRRLLGRAREHFLKEEMVLFPLASARIAAARLDFLGATWAATPRLGAA